MEPPITTQPADHRIPPAEEFYFGTSEDSSPGIDMNGRAHGIGSTCGDFVLPAEQFGIAVL